MNSSTTLVPALKKMNIGSASMKGNSVTFDIPENIPNISEYFNATPDGNLYKKQEKFIKALLSQNTEDSVFISWFKQLKDNIFLLAKESGHITPALLSFDWTQRSDPVVYVYQELILNLVSADITYLPPVLGKIISVFSKAMSEENEISKEESSCYQKAHGLLQNIASLIPSASDLLCSLLAESFPYFRKSSHLVLRYSTNMLNVTTYLPSHRLIILCDLVDKILEIDVRCPRDTIETYELEKEENHEESIMDIEGLPDEDMNMAYPLANTLDLLMSNFFMYLDCTCRSNEKFLNWEVTKKLFREMLTVFDKLILPTHRCSHVQFLLFYLCSWKLALCEGFLDYLWKKVKNPNTAPVRRQVATFYIGSLLARATFVTISTVTACFDMMCEWVHSYINNYDSRNCSDVSAHGTFHCVCQMLFYVFAFRHKEFINMKNGFKYLRGLNFERIITCRLNPLKFCQPIIVQNFASVARNYQIAYCYPVIERNNRSLVLGMIHMDNFAAVNSYFPFDPYQLKRSKKWIDPIYRIYQRPENEECPNKEEEIMSTENTELQPSNSAALFSYGSSPGFKKFISTSPKIR